MEENMGTNPQKPKMGKKKKIVIAIIALVVVAIATVVVLGFTGVIDFNFTKKSKADAGIGKVSEVFTDTANDLETELNDAGLSVKALDKESITDVDASVDVSFDIKEIEIENLDSDETELIDDIIDLVNQVKVGAEAKVNSEGKLNVKLDAVVGEEPISVEATYDGEKIGVRSEELNEKWLTLDVEKLLAEVELDEDAIEELEKITEEVQTLVEKLLLTEDEVKHFKSTYSKILTEYVTSLEIESEKDTIEVGDKEKKCTKTTITLDEDDVKNLLITYIESVENDEKGQNIVKEKIKLVCDFIIENEEIFTSNYGYDYYYDQVNDYYNDYYYDDYYYDDYSYDYVDSPIDDVKDFAESIDEIFTEDNFEMIKDAIDDLYMGDIEVTIETYSTLTNIYATNITFEVEGEGIVLAMTFDGDTTNATVSMKASGMSMDMIDLVLVNEKNHKSLEIKAADDVVDYIGTEISGKIDCTISNNNLKTTLSLDLGDEGNVVFTQNLKVKTNTDSEYSATSSNNIKLDIPDVMKIDATVNIDIGLKTANVKIASINSGIDLTDAMMTGEPDATTTKELEQYVEDAIPEVVDILKGLKEIDIIKEYLSEDIDDAITELESVSFDEVIGTVY